MSQVASTRSSAASCSRSRSRRRNRKRKHSCRSASTASSRGPYNVADSQPQKPPWYEAAEFSRFWSHYSALMYSAHMSVLRHATAADVCPCERQAPRSRNKAQKRRKGHESRISSPPEDKWRPLSPTPNPASPRLCFEHKLLLNAQSRRCSRSTNATKRCNASKKKAHGGSCHVAEHSWRGKKDAPHKHGGSRYYDDYAQNNSTTGILDSKLNRNIHEDFHGDPYSEDQESASELTSQMRGGMSLSDDQDPPVSEEFLAFMQQTIRHKEEWAKKKAAGLQQLAVPAGNALISQQGDDIAPQKEHPDAVRSREMKALYGPAAPQLHAMETAVQLAFDRVATRHHARVWPNIPINIMFSDE